jgi:hypothetical protein
MHDDGEIGGRMERFDDKPLSLPPSFHPSHPSFHSSFFPSNLLRYRTERNFPPPSHEFFFFVDFLLVKFRLYVREKDQ